MNIILSKYSNMIENNAVEDSSSEISELDNTIKRKASCIETLENIPKKKRRIHDDLNTGAIHEFLRDEAFFMGLQEKNKHYRKMQNEMEMEIEEDVVEKKSCDVVPLRKMDEKTIAEIQEKKGLKLSCQFFELYQVLMKKHLLTTNLGEAVLKFAFQIIEKVPDLSDDMEESIDEEYLEMANTFLSQMPIQLSESDKLKLARNLQAGMECAENEQQDTEIKEATYEAIVELSYLLLILCKDEESAIECALLENFEDGIELLKENVFETMRLSKKEMEKNKSAHSKTTIQCPNEALFQQMSIEMADLLLLPTGSINFGLMETLSENLIPENFQNLIAVETLNKIMANLSSSSHLWQLIASVDLPQNEKNPSTFAIRSFLKIPPQKPILKRHAQIFVLSAFLGHYRQASVGSCFATAWLIKALHYYPELFLQDLKQLTEEGRASRITHGEVRHFPYFTRVSREFLNKLVEVDSSGYLLNTYSYKKNKKSTPENAYLYEAPGIIQACIAMNISNVKEAVLECLQTLESKFCINDLMKKLSARAYQLQESNRYHLRSFEHYTEDEFLMRAQFGFGIQTNHPLHLAYDQVGASMVSYFGTQYAIPAWIHETLTEVIDKTDKGCAPKVQMMFKKLQGEIFLPLITRIRFRYNPHIDDNFTLFNDGNYGVEGHTFYGYELCDGGLPKDFSYSQALYKQYCQRTSTMALHPFKQYPQEHTWKVINNQDKFQDFIQDIVNETVEYLKFHENREMKKTWDDVKELFLKKIACPEFGKRMVHLLLGKSTHQKNEWNKNPHQMATTPWTFRWGGDFDAVMQTYFGFTKEPSQMKPFNGTPREVLAKTINFIKKQTEEIKKELTGSESLLLMTSPVHAFLMKPDESSFVKAVYAEEFTNDYIAAFVETPGVKIANSRLSIKAYKQVIDFIAENKWMSRQSEKDDFERQKLTDFSKKVLDGFIRKHANLYKLSTIDFKNELYWLAIQARSLDPLIGSRNHIWEKQLELAMNRLLRKLVPENKWNETIPQDIAKNLISFARDQEDTMALSEKAKRVFLDEAKKMPFGLSIKDFRVLILKAANLAHESDTHLKNSKFMSILKVQVDELLFRILPENERRILLKSMIITYDPNWKDGIYDYRAGFMVNPGTAKIELCCYKPDLEEIEFLDQDSWFPSGKKSGRWQFPDNYRSYKSGPLFNMRNHLGC